MKIIIGTFLILISLGNFHLKAAEKSEKSINQYDKSIQFYVEQFKQSKNNYEKSKISDKIMELYWYKGFILIGDLLRFQSALDDYFTALKIDPHTKNDKIFFTGAHAAFWLALDEFGKGDFKKAEYYFNIFEDIKLKNLDVVKSGYLHVYSFFKSIFDERTAMKKFRPVYTSKALLLCVKKAKFELNIPKELSVSTFQDIFNKLTDSERKDTRLEYFELNKKRNVYVLKDRERYGWYYWSPLHDLLKKNGIRVEDPLKFELKEIDEISFKKSIIVLNMLKRIIEVWSNGNLSMEVLPLYVDGAYTKVHDGGEDPNSIQPDISKILYKYSKECDLIINILHSSSKPDLGGTGRLPIIPYHFSSPRRGMIWYTEGLDHPEQMGKVTHEYFHTIEGLWGIPAHFNYRKSLLGVLPGWTKYDDDIFNENRNELHYFRWQFRNTIPNKIDELKKKGEDIGWKKFGRSIADPLLMSEDVFEYNLKAVENVPLQNREKSLELKELANKAWKNKEYEKADGYYSEAFKLNPAFYDYYKHFGDREIQKRNYEKAIELYDEYIKFTDSFFHTKKIGDTYQKNLKKYDDAIKYYQKAIIRAYNLKEKASTCVQWGYSLMRQNKYKDAIEIFNDGIKFQNTDESNECLFLKGDCLSKLGEKEEGIALMKLAIGKGLNKNKWYNNRYNNYIKK